MPGLKGGVFARFSGAKMAILHNARSAIGTPAACSAWGVAASVFRPILVRLPEDEAYSENRNFCSNKQYNFENSIEKRTVCLYNSVISG